MQRVPSLRIRILVTLFVCIFLCYHTLKLCDIRKQMDSSGVFIMEASNALPKRDEIQYVYSSDLVREAIRVIRHRNCLEYFHAEPLSSSCEWGSSVDRDNDTDFARVKRLPGCIITGAYESGIRALTDLLSMHPQIVTRRKFPYQVNYFEKHSRRDQEFYRNQMPVSVPGQLTVDSGAEYFYSDQTPEGLHTMNSSMRLLVMVKDPLQRALSEFHAKLSIAKEQYGDSFYTCAFNVARGRVNEKCFAVNHSLYDIPIQRYLQYFDKDQLMIIDADEFARNPLPVLKRVEDHLRLYRIIKDDYFLLNEIENRYCIRPDPTKPEAVCGDSRTVVSYESPSLKDKLRSLFKEHNERFFNLTGTRFQWS